MRVGVVGGGVVGLSAVLGLRERGADVTCYERTGAAMTERSAGSSRIFRLAHGDPELVALAAAARAGFARWSERAGALLVHPVGCAVSGEGVPEWEAAMAAAGAEHRIVDGAALGLPVRRPPAEALLDPAGGVIDVDAVRVLLTASAGPALVPATVYDLQDDPGGVTVHSSAGAERFDTVLVAAGAGTSALAARAGVWTPTTLSHHVRFSFPVQPATGAPRPAWIDKPAGEPGTYQHESGPGRWSVGGYVDPAATAWERGRAAATEASEAAAVRYARERLSVPPDVVDRLYCTHAPDLGDGIHLRHGPGRVLAVYGENLFKFAPVLADQLATACLTHAPTTGS